MSDLAARAIAKSVRAERSRQHLTQAALGERLGWSQQKVASIENGTRQLFAHELIDVALALDVNLRALLVGVPEEQLRRLGL
jgi:transcriptional regulator with XRE-family HTH domain